MNRFYKFMGGRSTCFAMMIFWATVFLAMKGKLIGEVVALMTIVQALVTYRSIKQDNIPNG